MSRDRERSGSARQSCCFAGHTKTEKVLVKIQNDVIITTSLRTTESHEEHVLNDFYWYEACTMIYFVVRT